MKDMEHIIERSWFADQAGRSKTATVTTRRLDPGHTLAVAAAGTLLVLVAFTVPLATPADKAAGLGAGPGAQAWVLSSMSLGSAAGLLSSGAIGDDYGRRRTFLAGAQLLAASSLLGALAPDALVLVTAGFSLLGALAVLLARECTSRSEPDGSGPAGPS
jgi:MFS family permease